MANDVIRLKVDKNVYMETLNQLDTQLQNLRTYEHNLQVQINSLNSGNVFEGSDVKCAVEKAEEALQAVTDGISRVMGHRMAIQKHLDGVEGAAATLASDMNSIDVPNMFG